MAIEIILVATSYELMIPHYILFLTFLLSIALLLG